MVSNVFLFMIAGYETTSTALAYSTYVLATKPEIQDKLVEEIDQHNWNNRRYTPHSMYQNAIHLIYKYCIAAIQ